MTKFYQCKAMLGVCSQLICPCGGPQQGTMSEKTIPRTLHAGENSLGDFFGERCR
jgi:hypothetical protein